MSQPCRCTSGRNLTVAQDCTEYACVDMCVHVPGPYPAGLYCTAHTVQRRPQYCEVYLARDLVQGTGLWGARECFFPSFPLSCLFLFFFLLLCQGREGQGLGTHP